MTAEPNAKPNGGLEKPVYDPTAPSAIEVDHIVKKYGDFTAVDDVSFSVKEGEIFGLLGPNGAGKSTLIRMMTTLIPITSGKARIAGHDVAKEPDAARRITQFLERRADGRPGYIFWVWERFAPLVRHAQLMGDKVWCVDAAPSPPSYAGCAVSASAHSIANASCCMCNAGPT